MECINHNNDHVILPAVIKAIIKCTTPGNKVPRQTGTRSVAHPASHFEGINLAEFQLVIAYDIGNKNVVMQV